MKLKKYRKKTFGSYISKEIIIILVSIISSILVVNYFYKQFNSVIMPMAESLTRKYMTNIINDSTKNVNIRNDLFVIQRNDDNEIKMINYNSYEATQLINEITSNIENRFNNIESDDTYVLSTIPLGVVFKNGMLRNFGPRIKIRIETIGNVISELETVVKPYGINNALIEVRVKLKANARVVLPLTSKEITVTNVIPLSINIVNGSIPEAYISTYK